MKHQKSRYRLRTLRRLDAILQENGDMTIRELAEASGKDPKVVRRYLNYFPGVFQRRTQKRGRASIWGVALNDGSRPDG